MTFRSFAAIAFIAATLMITPAQAEHKAAWPAKFPARDRSAIEAALKEQDNAWNAGDAKGFTAYALDDVTLTSVIGSVMVGRDQWEKESAGTLAGSGKGSVMHRRVENVSAPTKDVAVVDLVSAVKGIKNVPAQYVASDGNVYSRSQQVLVRQGPKWRIVAIHGVLIEKPFLPKWINAAE